MGIFSLILTLVLARWVLIFLVINYYEIYRKYFFLIPLAKVAQSLPAVLTKVPLFAEGMRKNSIRDSGVNKECLKQQVYHPRLRLGR